MKLPTSILALQNLDSDTMISAPTGRTVAIDACRAAARRPPQLDGRPGGAEGLAAVGDETALVAQQHLLQQDHDDAEHEQRRAERGGGAVLHRRLRHVAVDLGGDDVDPGGAAQQQRGGELAETEQQGDATAVDQRRAAAAAASPGRTHRTATSPATCAASRCSALMFSKPALTNR